MIRRMLVVALLVVIAFLKSSTVFGYTDEEQYRYDNIYLQLPWEPADYILLTQANRDTPTHLVGSLDEYSLDFGLVAGTPVVAAASGVAYVYRDGHTAASPYGNHVKIDHGYFYTLYAHLSSIEAGIDGCEVKKGEIIGFAGSTGGSWRPHLHFGLFHGYAWKDGYSNSVKSKIVVANEGTGPYQTLESTQFVYGQFYLSGNFKSGEEGMIVCESIGCYVDTSFGSGGSGSLPDLIVEKVWLENEEGKETTTFHVRKKIKAYARIRNIGGLAPANDFQVKFRLSEGEEKDDHPEVVDTDTAKKEDFNPGQSKTISAEFDVPEEAAKYYNLVVCADTESEVIEANNKNNCSDEKVFLVRISKAVMREIIKMHNNPRHRQQ